MQTGEQNNYRPQRSTRLEFVHPDDVIVGDRVRETLGDMEGLKESVNFFGGVIQPIAVLDIGMASGPISFSDAAKPNATYILVAGHRRFVSCVTGGHVPIPAIVFEGWSMEDLWSAELHENIQRLAFSPVEEDKAVARAHRTLLKQARAKGDEHHTIRKTAEALNLSLKSAQDALKRVRAVKENPELEKAKTKKEIDKFIKKQTRAEQLEQIRKLAELSRKADAASSDDPFNRLLDAYKIGSFLDFDLEPGYKFVEFDPPYSIGLNEKRKDLGLPGNVRIGKYIDLPTEEYQKFMEAAIPRCFELMDDNSWIILWGDLEWYEYHFDLLKTAGFNIERYDWAFWAKPTGQCRAAQYHFANAAEVFLYGRKGDPHILHQGRKNWFEYPIPVRQGRHETEKPIELYEEILTRFVPASSRLLCPCAGSGNFLFAGENHLCKVEGFDLETTYRDDFLYRARTWPRPYKSFKS